MAASGGHWLNLAEAQKLTQAHLVPGVIQTTINRGGIVPRLPIFQVAGTNVTWNRENAVQVANMAGVGDVLQWQESVTYTQKTATLQKLYLQTPLDKYIADTYGNFNNYRAIQMMENSKAMITLLEDKLIYGDTAVTNEFSGLHEICADNATGDRNIDEGDGAPSIMNLRTLIDAMKEGVDFLLFPFELARRLDAYLQEAGLASWVGSGTFVMGPGDVGMRVTMFDGIPILRSDYLVAEAARASTTADTVKYTSGTKYYSYFAVKLGNIGLAQPGLTLVFGGNDRAPGEFFRAEHFDKLEDYDAEGLRLTSYAAVANGSVHAVGRVIDCTDAAWTN